MDPITDEVANDAFLQQQIEAYKRFEESRNSPQKSAPPSPIQPVQPVQIIPIHPQFYASAPPLIDPILAQSAQHQYWENQANTDNDYLLALKFQQEEEEATRKARGEQMRQAEISDAELARKFQMEEEMEAERLKQEQKRKAELADEELAKRLLEQEQAAIKTQQDLARLDEQIATRMVEEERRAVEKEEARRKQEAERKDWEATLNLIRDEAKSEAQQELERLQREKRDLERQLERQRNDRVYGGPPIELSLADVEYPHWWVNRNSSNHEILDVPKGSSEYHDISSKFLNGMPRSKITRIQRNQNRQIWMWYWLKKNEIAQKNGRDANERLVWHGSRNNAYDLILREGFDIRVANMNGAIGAGIYFGVSSSTSNGYVVGNERVKKMFYCRVLLGEMGNGQQGLRRPPEKRKGHLYDSVGNTTMYVVFDNNQAFPEYVIHYT